MFGVGIGIKIGGNTIISSSYDADAQAFFDRVTTAGGTLSTTEKNATNQLVLDLKSAGIWTSMQAIYPMVGASAAACAQNLKSSSFTGTFTSGWTFSSTGVTGNGTSAYFDTNLNVGSNLSLTNSHLSFYSRTNFADASLRVDIGRGYLLAGSYINLYLKLESTSNQIGGNIGDKSNNITNTNSACFGLNSAISSTSLKTYRNNTLIATNPIAATGNLTQTANIYIGSQGGNATPGQYSNRECAFASIGDGLTDTQALDFYTTVQTFNTTLSRQV
jgi:hypothetical protein